MKNIEERSEDNRSFNKFVDRDMQCTHTRSFSFVVKSIPRAFPFLWNSSSSAVLHRMLSNVFLANSTESKILVKQAIKSGNKFFFSFPDDINDNDGY